MAAKETQAQAAAATTTTTAEDNFLDQVVSATKPKSDAQIERAKEMLQTFVKQLMSGATVSKEPTGRKHGLICHQRRAGATRRAAV